VAEGKRLTVLQVISSSATSGAERHVFCLSDLLRRRGHRVEVVCPIGGWLPEKLRDAGIPVHQTEMKGRGWFGATGLLLRRMREGDIDLVHSHLTRATYFGALAGMVRRIPAIATVHVANHDQIYKRMARRRNRLIAVSNFVRGALHGRGIPDRFIDTVYNGTDFGDLAADDPSTVKEEFGIASNRRLIGLVGRVCREKGHLLMVEAMRDVAKEHPDAHVMFVGKIEEQFKLEVEDAIASAGLEDRVTLAGVRHDVPRLLDSFEFTTMPSHRETFGLAAIEAMARGKAVVASRVGGLPEVVRHHQTGLLIDLRPQELAEAVSYLFQNEAERKQMGSLGRTIVQQKFTLEHMVDRLESIYQRTLEGA
jgi:glycosyltransferase involved in cell wall biosynthesis